MSFDEKMGPRNVRFPPGRSMGVLCVRDWGMPGYGGWQNLTEARGSVAVPAGKELMLKLNWGASTDLSPIGYLRPEDLQWLDCRDTQVNDEGLYYVRGLAGLHDLGLGHTNITNAGMKHLENLHSLRELYLVGLNVTDAGIAPVGKLASLRALALNDTGIGDKGAETLSGLNMLRRLWLKGTQITDAGLMQLKTLTNLKRLDLRDMPITEEGLANLKRALPHCYIVR